ncbi:MAG: hypothetical protein U0R81_11895 [Mycobacterium sp.]
MNPHLDEIVLLTYKWEPMQRWWAALVGVEPHTLDRRTVVLETARMRVVIEHSEIAMNANPEVAGVISLTLSTPSAANALEIHTRLAAIGSSHHRATDDAGGVRLWYRDPNGTDVALRLPLDASPGNRHGQEIDPDRIIARLQAAAGEGAVSSE